MQFSPENHRRLNHRSGLTLVELLVVIAIITIVSAATIPLFTPPLDDQKTREAARMFSTMLESARSRAVESGRPAGIWLQTVAGNPLAVSDMFTCEVPEPYSGGTTSSTAAINYTGLDSNNIPQIRVDFQGDSGIADLCRAGDLIRFSSSGEYFELSTAANTFPTNYEASLPNIAFLNLRLTPPPTTPIMSRPAPGFIPLDTAAAPRYVTYQIIRQPMKSAGTPLTLPGNAPAALIDLASSGIGLSDTRLSTNGPNHIWITFEPSGQVSKIFYHQGAAGRLESPLGTLYFLVRLNKDPPAPNVVGTGDGFRDQSATWVSINSATGLVSVSDNTYSPTSPNNTVDAARAGAQRATQKGGL